MAKTPEEILAAEAGVGRGEGGTRTSRPRRLRRRKRRTRRAMRLAMRMHGKNRLSWTTTRWTAWWNESQEVSDEGIDDDGHDRG